MARRTKVLIMGAAGRDFHNFNTFFRGNEQYEVVAFTATQIPHIDERKYPAVLAGKLDARDYIANRDDYLAVEWHTPKWAWVDPEKDVKAEIMAIRAGLKARSMSINETGQDEEEVDEQIARDNARADRLGLVLDSDPRKTDGRGQAANILETGDGGDAPDGGAPADSKPEPPKPQQPKPKRKEPKK